MSIAVLLHAWRKAPDQPVRNDRLGPGDQVALGCALKLRGEAEGETLTALTLGDADEEPVLQLAHAQGVDRLVRVWDPMLAEVDDLALARVLAATLQTLKIDLAIAGFRSAARRLGYMGPAVAECLDWPALTAVTSLDWHEDREALQATRDWREGTFTHRIPRPGLVTVQDGPALPDATTGGELTVEVFDLDAVALDPTLLRPRIQLMGPVTEAPPRKPDPTDLEGTGGLIEHLQDLDLY